MSHISERRSTPDPSTLSGRTRWIRYPRLHTDIINTAMTILGDTAMSKHGRMPYVLAAWLFGVTLEHGGGDFAVGRPLPPPLSRVGLVAFQACGVRLHDLAALQKQQAQFLRGHPRHEGLRIVESGT